MEFISRIITILLDLLVRPFGPIRHTLGLVWLSLLSGAGMALVFRAAAPARSVRAAKNRFKSYIYEMRIYQDSLRAVFGAFARSLWSNLLYIKAILPPILILAVPAILLFYQLDERYGADHLSAGETTVLTVRLSGGADPAETEAALACGPGASVDAGPVRISDTGEISWRLRIEEAGTHRATLSVDGAAYTLRLVADPAFWRIARARGSGPLEPFIHPGAPPIPKGSRIESVRVDYPGASYPLLFWRTHWIVIFLFYTIVGAAAIKLAVGFEI
ncbi:MAG TPA: hypothetical protein ENO08_03895 [Candidatus Eisenbacteria bacterium]|uniref:Uncharacterized protein n=1 Tax=Eiseniibacteriota bacterium TaxID=2212470 RepID=A0A7V2AUS4_UNCEI|nr:hypothetical protein [Candidatus Eisenbacteria bacterium]